MTSYFTHFPVDSSHPLPLDIRGQPCLPCLVAVTPRRHGVCSVYLAVDVTPYAIGVTAALAVGIVVMVAVIVAYFRARRRIEQLRRPPVDIKLRKVRKDKSSASKTSAAANKNNLPDEVLEILRERRRRAAEKEMLGFEFTYVIIYHSSSSSSSSSAAAAVTVM